MSDYLGGAGMLLFLVMVALIPLQLYLDMSTKKFLRHDYPELWKEKISTHGLISEQMRFMQFIANIGSYDSVDKKLRSRAKFLRLVNWTYLILFFGMFLFLLASFAMSW